MDLSNDRQVLIASKQIEFYVQNTWKHDIN